MATCASGQLPYKVDYSAADFSGNTPAEACQKNGVAYNGYYAVLNNGTYCEVGWSGSGDGHAILTVCDVAVSPSTSASAPGYSPFWMDEGSAVAIGGAILLVMAVAFVFRMARKSLESEKESES